MHLNTAYPNVNFNPKRCLQIAAICVRKLVLVLILYSIHDRGQTHRVNYYHASTPTRAGLRRCRWRQPRHAARLVSEIKFDFVPLKKYSADACMQWLK